MSNKRIFSKELVILIRNIQGKVTEKPLRELIKTSIKNYLYTAKDTNDVTNLYKILLAEIEQPLLDIIMQYTRGNQTKAALMMGINRGTLRKKLKKYRMG